MRSASATAAGPGSTPQRPAPAVDLDQHGHPKAGVFGGGLDERLNALPHRFSTGADPGDTGQGCEARQLARGDDLVADQDIRHAAPGQRLRLRHLLHALADRTAAPICWSATTGDLCVLPACARSFAPVSTRMAAMVSRLCSKASRSSRTRGFTPLAHAGFGGRGCDMRHGVTPGIGAKPPIAAGRPFAAATARWRGLQGAAPRRQRRSARRRGPVGGARAPPPPSDVGHRTSCARRLPYQRRDARGMTLREPRAHREGRSTRPWPST